MIPCGGYPRTGYERFPAAGRILFLFMAALMAALLFTDRPACAMQTTLGNGAIVEWDVGLTDLRLVSQSSTAYGWPIYYYESSQLSAFGNTLNANISITQQQARTGAVYVYSPVPGYNPPIGLPSLAQGWTTLPAGGWYCKDGYEIYPPVMEDLVLNKNIFVHSVPEAGYAAFGLQFGAKKNICDDSTLAHALIVISLSESARRYLGNNPQWLGGKDDNPFTDFDGNQSCDLGFPVHSVNTSTLNLVVEDTEFAVQGLGPGLASTRTWNSDPSRKGIFGNGWSFLYESTIRKTCTEAIVASGSGSETSYRTTGNLCTPDALSLPLEMTPPQAVVDTLTYMSGDYWLLRKKHSRMTHRYDPAGGNSYRLTSIADRNGNTLRLFYNADGNISSVTDASGRSINLTYNSNRLVSVMAVPGGRQATFTHDSRGNLTQSVDLYGTVITYEYDTENYMSAMSYAGKTIRYGYDSSGGWKHVATVTDAEGNIRRYGVDPASNGTIREVTDSRDGITRYEGNGNTSKRTNQLGATASTSYNSSALPSSHTDYRGTHVTMEYDSRRNLTRKADYYKATTFTHDADDNLLTVTDPLNQTLSHTYDANGNLTGMTLPSGKTRTFAYNARGQLVADTDADGRTTSYGYDAFGNLKTVTDPLGKVTTFGYDSIGLNRTSITDANSRTLTFSYDQNRRLTGVTYPDGTRRTYGYDACSLTSSTDENGTTTRFSIDRTLRLTGVQDAFNASTTYAYDGNGNRVLKIDPLLQTIGMEYDAADRLSKLTDPLGNSIGMSRDGNGNVIGVMDERQKISHTEYNIDNQPTSWEYPLGSFRYFTRDLLGRVTRFTNIRGGMVDFVHDKDNRVVSKKQGATTVAGYGYNNEGRLVSYSDVTGTTAYSRNGRNEVTGITYPDGKKLSFTYDNVGNITAIGYPGGVTLTYGVSNRNRITGMQWGAASMTFTHDPSGNTLTINRSNGTTTARRYDDNGRVSSIAHARGGVPFASMNYSRNSAGNIIAEALSLPASITLAPMSATGVYDNSNRIASYGGTYFTHDSDGNMTGMTGATSFTALYDEENRLTSMTRGGIRSDFTYDARGNRVLAVRGGTTAKYYHDHLGRMLFEADGSGTIVRYYLYRGRHLEAVRTASGASYFHHYDKTGNTVAITDGSGAIVKAYAYTPYGEQVGNSGTFENRHTYVGAYGVQDEGLGMYFMKNRYYDATLGRFIQTDPIRFAGGTTNLYRYVRGNPVTRIDPSGTSDNDFDGYPDEGGWSEVPRKRETKRLDQAVAEERMNGDFGFTYATFMGTYGEADNNELFWVLDKFTNGVENTPFGCAYAAPKTAYYAGSGQYGKAAWEGFKLAMGIAYGGIPLALTLDVAGDVAGSDWLSQRMQWLMEDHWYGKYASDSGYIGSGRHFDWRTNKSGKRVPMLVPNSD